MRRVRPVHPDHRGSGPTPPAGSGRDRDARGVAGEDGRCAGARRSRSAKTARLEVGVLGHGLDDEVGIGNGLARVRRARVTRARLRAAAGRRSGPARRAQSRPRPAAGPGRPRSSRSSATSIPPLASVAAIPGPMVPVPTIATRFMMRCLPLGRACGCSTARSCRRPGRDRS